MNQYKMARDLKLDLQCRFSTESRKDKKTTAVGSQLHSSKPHGPARPGKAAGGSGRAPRPRGTTAGRAAERAVPLEGPAERSAVPRNRAGGAARTERRGWAARRWAHGGHGGGRQAGHRHLLRGWAAGMGVKLRPPSRLAPGRSSVRSELICFLNKLEYWKRNVCKCRRHGLEPRGRLEMRKQVAFSVWRQTKPNSLLAEDP